MYWTFKLKLHCRIQLIHECKTKCDYNLILKQKQKTDFETVKIEIKCNYLTNHVYLFFIYNLKDIDTRFVGN